MAIHDEFNAYASRIMQEEFKKMDFHPDIIRIAQVLNVSPETALRVLRETEASVQDLLRDPWPWYQQWERHEYIREHDKEAYHEI